MRAMRYSRAAGDDLRVEDLPGEQAGLPHDLVAVFRVGVAVEVEALVQEALAARVHQDAERIVVLLEPIADAMSP